jgi:NTE family protein
MRVAVALSGGGFRAALFHMGVLRRVAELGWLPSIDAISGVSGGSIIAAFAALQWGEMLSAGGDAAAFEKHIAGPFVTTVTTSNVLSQWLARAVSTGPVRIFDRTFTRTTAFGDILDESLYGNRPCTELPDSPYTVLNATSLTSVRAWRFTRHGLGDSRIGYAEWNSRNILSIGQAVASSAAFPPIFSPARINARRYTFSGTMYRDAPVDVPNTIALTDGGVYENLGTEVLTKPTPLPAGKVLTPAEFLLVSDGGYPARYEFDLRWLPGLASLALLRCVNTIALEQVSALRRRRLIEMFEGGRPNGLLVALGSNLDRIPVGGADAYRRIVGSDSCPPVEVVDRIQRVRTHLNRFSQEEAEALMYHGYVLTDAFLWARSAHLPTAYQRTDQSPEWRIVFTPEITARTLDALKRSHLCW